jgi:hypothetical protein
MNDCLKDCEDCHLVCEETIMYCLALGGAHAEAEHIGLLMDCAQICQTSADFMIRGSSNHESVCGVCAQLCNLCADDCEQLGDDEQMQACVEMCRKCAQSCEQLAQGQGQHAS